MSKDNGNNQDDLVKTTATLINVLPRAREFNTEKVNPFKTQKMAWMPRGIKESQSLIDKINKNDPSLKIADFSDLKSKDTSSTLFLLSLISNAMINNNHLEGVNLSNLKMDNYCMDQVIEILREGPHIKSLDLSNCSISRKALIPLFEFLQEEIPQKSLSLTRLNLAGNKFGNKEEMTLHLVSRMLRDNQIPDEEYFTINEEIEDDITEKDFEDVFGGSFSSIDSSQTSSPINANRVVGSSDNEIVPKSSSALLQKENQPPADSPKPKEASKVSCTPKGCTIS